MRILVALPLLLLAACQVSKGDNETQVSLNADVAENKAEALLNEAEQAAGNAAERLERVTDKVEEKVDNVDVDINLKGGDTDGNAAEPANAH